MSARGKACLFGLFVWLVPFAVAFMVFPLRESARPLFESIMPVTVTAASTTFAVAYFRGVSRRFLAEGVALGCVWLGISLVIDLPLMLTGGPMQMTLGQYVADIGLTYVIIPIVTIGIGASCARVSAAAGAPA